MAVHTIGKAKAKAIRYWVPALCVLMITMQLLMTCGVFAAGAEAVDGSNAINAVLNFILPFVKIFIGVLGTFFTLFGLVNLIIAHNNSQGPDMQKAQTQLAVGVMLVILAVALNADRFSGLINIISGNG